MTFVVNEFKESDADIVSMIENNVIAKNKLFVFRHKRGGRYNRWGGIRNVKFTIIKKGNIRKAKYKVDLTRTFVPAFIIGIISGLFSDTYKIGLLIFIALWSINLLIKIIHHWIIFSDILIASNFMTINDKK
mgnify:CR=1 FL=1